MRKRDGYETREKRTIREVELPEWMWDARDFAPNYGIGNAEALIEKAVREFARQLPFEEASRLAWARARTQFN